MKRANKVNARVAVILGEAEIARQVATVRDMDSGAQREVSLAQLEDELGQYC
jgi:histidyl-tRNA synthetase